MMSLANRALAVPATCIVLAALSGAARAQSQAQGTPTDVLFLADPQIHNVYGTGLKQTTSIADWVAKVAIRPAELNLLAPLVLREALKRGQEGLDSKQPVVVLGDATNIGCSGEWDAFVTEMATVNPGRVWLAAHGNHDSYMMGTVNSYIPTNDTANVLNEMTESTLPTDHSWWTGTDRPIVAAANLFRLNWADVCYKPKSAKHERGTPMNKVRWLARYLAHLAKYGLTPEHVGSGGNGGLKLGSTVAAGSSLGAMNFRLRGVWYRPGVAPVRVGDRDYMRSWQSFIVQAFDVGTSHTVVLVDTSVCKTARGGLKFQSTNAGQHACLGTEQFDTIASLLREIPAGRHVVLGGHFPLSGLRSEERTKLTGMLSERIGTNPKGWTYISAHTHNRITTRKLDGGRGRDVNIGSTTDWPMESHVLTFEASSSSVAAVRSTTMGDYLQPLAYKPAKNPDYSELCRHLPVAEALVKVQDDQIPSEWTSPSIEGQNCKRIEADWQAEARGLEELQRRISERFDHSATFRRFVLRLAAGASRHEDQPSGTFGRPRDLAR